MLKLEINKVRDFTKEQDYQGFAVVRLSTHQMGDFPRRTWVWIEADGKRILRKVRGANLHNGAMALDYDSRLELGVSGESSPEDNYYKIQATITKAGWIGRQIGYWKIPDDSFVIAHRLGVLGITLGVIGVILGVLGLLK